MRKLTFSAVLLWLCSVVPVFSATDSNTVTADPATQVRINENYGKLPLRFEVNAGQTDGQVRFLSRGSGYSMYLTPTETVMVLNKSGQPTAHSPQPTAHSPQPTAHSPQPTAHSPQN